MTTDQEFFIYYLQANRKEKKLWLALDIETLQYNENAGKNHPSDYKNVTYSVAVGYYADLNADDLRTVIFQNFQSFFDAITNAFKKTSGDVYAKTPVIELIIHNGNKYDNHFILKDACFYFPHIQRKDIFLTNATDEGNALTKTMKSITKPEKQGIMLEKRVKSSINLELNFFLNGIQYKTTDNWMKTNVSIKTLGQKLLKLDLIDASELKTDFNYTLFNRDYDMTDSESHAYAAKCFDQLDGDQLTYIRNDVIILAKSVKYYSELFKGFDYSKMTFTANILESYNDNELTSYQLLNKIGKTKEDKIEILYTDYKFAGENFYDYVKSFYKGGLNFYNQDLIGRILTGEIFSVDINSSYPYAMHNFKTPTYLEAFESYETEKEIPIEHNEFYYMYRMKKETFDKWIIDNIESRIICQMLVKYYASQSYVNINSYTIDMIELITGISIPSLPVLSWLKYECEYFGSREKIEEYYFIKTQGKNPKKIIMNSPYDIRQSTEDNTDQLFSQEEIDNAKVMLNGLYGIPALRPYFNLFRTVGDQLINIINGFENTQRNIVFSIFVTSVSLYNLLSPLQFLTAEQIDENFIYADTDSLYLFKSIKHLIPVSFFHPYHLGSWDIENETITKMYVLNHKKYAYETTGKDGLPKIVVKCGGVPGDAFNKNVPFDTFIEEQFSPGVTVHNLKSIYNNSGTISFYPSETVLDLGSKYRVYAYNPKFDDLKEQLFSDIRKNTRNDEPDAMYIESSIGTFSMADVYPMKHIGDDKKPLRFLQFKQKEIKERLSCAAID